MSAQSSISPTARLAGQWFHAAEESGDYMGIRYGRGSVGSKAVEWSFVPHAECDGIGGFARLLREQGVDLPTLPMTTHSKQGAIRSLWNLYRASRQENRCALREDWARYDEGNSGPSPAVAWHLFTEAETTQIRQNCRQQSVSVNSHLMKQLDQAVRPDIHSPEAILQWMIPVNLRGNVTHLDDTANHVSYVKPRIGFNDTATDIQQQIRHRLTRSEYWGSYLMMLGLGKLLSARAKVKLIAKDRSMPKGNIGAFSNLGVWDSGKTLATDDFWLFCPPVANGQLLGAGCVTFQNRLSLTTQAHSRLSDQPEAAMNWMSRWVERTSG